jgi:ribosomal protein S18 acetylase RimI-like enzyme
MIDFTEAQKKDIPRLAVLYINLALYIKQETKDPYFEINEIPEQELTTRLKVDIQDQSKKIFVAVEDNNILGFIACEIIDCFFPFSKINKVGYISAAYVSEDHRRKGIMKKLEIMSTDFFRRHSLEYAELNVISNNVVGKKIWNSLGYNTFREQMRKKLT